MHWFIDPIKNHYADFEGRVGRQEYWMFVLIWCLIQVGFMIIGLDLIAMLVWLGALVPDIALTTRRLHDTGRSGWWQLLCFIPIIGWIILIIWLAEKTHAEANEYGTPAVPKTGEEGVAPVVSAPVAAMATDSVVPMTSTTDTKTNTMSDTKPDTTPDSSADSDSSSDGGGSSD